MDNLKKHWRVALVAALVTASTSAWAQQADALLKRVSQAMGAEPVNSIKYTYCPCATMPSSALDASATG